MIAFVLVTLCAAEPAAVDVPAQLRAFSPLVGEWRGVGQVRRGSTRGSWRETATWQFDFAGETPAVVCKVEDGAHISGLRVFVADSEVRGVITTLDGAEQPASVEKIKRGWVVQPENDGLRLTIRPLNTKRTTVLIEAVSGVRGRRVGEVGYTRQGESLAENVARGRECVVTGGRGTIKVTHDGRTYWVCCTGCKAAFEAGPEAFLAEAKTRAPDKAQSP